MISAEDRERRLHGQMLALLVFVGYSLAAAGAIGFGLAGGRDIL